MSERLNYAWRLVATGVAFAVIFFGGGILALALSPLFLIASKNRRRHTQYAVHVIFRLYIALLQKFGLMRLELLGLENISPSSGRLIVANHPSLLDVVLLMALIPDAQCIVKHQLWNHPFLGPVMRQAGYIRNDMGAEPLVSACQAAIDGGRNLIIFPEGTRTLPGSLPHFRTGFANVATLTRGPIQLVVITCEPPTLIKGQPWWKIPSIRPTFRLEVDSCMNMEPYLCYPYRSIGARRLTKFLESYYAKKTISCLTLKWS